MRNRRSSLFIGNTKYDYILLILFFLVIADCLRSSKKFSVLGVVHFIEVTKLFLWNICKTST